MAIYFKVSFIFILHVFLSVSASNGKLFAKLSHVIR